MDEATIMYIQIVGAILAILAAFFALIRYILPVCFKRLVKPGLKTKIIIGDVVDVVSPVTKHKLFTATAA